MAYEVVMPYHLHMPSYFLETFTEYPFLCPHTTYIQPSSLDIHIKKSATDKIALFLIMDIRLITLRYSVRWFVHDRDLQK